jgi:pimeloyl-ACP methyl ester carboxylesterase
MELVYLSTPDGYTCEGLFWPPAEPQTKLGAILVHGWTFWHDDRVRTRGFCGKYMAAVGERLARIGIPAVLSMNRGFHAAEFFNDCVIDFQTSLDFLLSKGCEEIVIIGHSLGGAKCAYFAGEVGHPRLRGVALMSAIPSSYNYAGKEELVARARQCVAEGRGQMIIPFEEKKTIALHEAETTVRSVDHAYRGTTLDAAAKIRVPILSLAAEREWGWFQEVTKGIERVATHAESLDTEIIVGARDHTYSGHEEYVATLVGEWARRRLLQR